MKACHVRIPESILKRLREMAAKDGRPMPELIREYLARGLRRDELEETPQRAAG